MDIMKKLVYLSAGNLYWKDLNSVYQGCNAGFAKLLPLSSPTDIIGKTDYDLLYDSQHADKVIENDKKVMQEGQEITVEEIGTNEAGDEAVYLSKKVPLRDEKGIIIGLVGTSIDITRQKQEELAKRNFIANISHDLRTPLSGIIGSAELLKNQIKKRHLSAYADNVLISGRALLNFLNEILETVKTTSSRNPLLHKKFNLKEVLQAVIALHQAKADEKNLSLQLHYEDRLPLCFVSDPKRIYRIVLELVANALKFTPQGEVSVIAELGKARGRDVVVKIIVCDTGIGIPADKQEAIFIQFNRLTPAYQGIYQGAGLGLTNVKCLMGELGGEIHVESVLQQGTTFTCVLPLKISLLDDPLEIDDTVVPLIQNTVKTEEVNMPSHSASLPLLRGKIIDIALGMKIMRCSEIEAIGMTELVMETFPEELTALEKAHTENDWETLEAIIHRIRGGVLYCGLPRLQTVCANIGIYLRKRQTELREALYAQMLEEMRAAQAAFSIQKKAVKQKARKLVASPKKKKPISLFPLIS